MNIKVPPAVRPSAASGTARSDAENQRLIEAVRKRHEALRSEKIRSEHDVKTLTQAVDDALRNVKAAFGTDDLDELRARVAENFQANTEATDAYLLAIETAEAALAQANQTAKH